MATGVLQLGLSRGRGISEGGRKGMSRGRREATWHKVSQGPKAPGRRWFLCRGRPWVLAQGVLVLSRWRRCTGEQARAGEVRACLLYTSDAADDYLEV